MKRPSSAGELTKYLAAGATVEGHWLSEVALLEVLKLCGRQDVVEAWLPLERWYS